jgi:DNA-directed RNA polymerase II subunit RPB1
MHTQMDEFEKSLTDRNFWKVQSEASLEDTTESTVYKPVQPRRANVARIAFGLIGSSEIRRRAVGEITTATLEERGYPKEGGPNDLRAGTMNRTHLCHTCEKNCTDCQGHALYIELPLPVVNISLVPMIVRVLRCICFGCAQLRAPADVIATIIEDEEAGHIWQTHRQRRLPVISEVLRKKRFCMQCDSVCPDISAKGASISWCWTSKKVEILAENNRVDPARTFIPPGMSLSEPFLRQKLIIDNAFIRATLLSVSDTEYRHLGLDPILAHPANAVMEVLLVPPPAVRPAVRYSESAKHRSEHDFTLWIQEIIRAKSRLLKLMKPSEAIGGANRL